MARVCVTDRGDRAGMDRQAQPVCDRGADRSSSVRSLAFGARRFSRDEQDDTILSRHRLRQSHFQRGMGTSQCVAMKVDHPVGRDHATGEAPIPTPIKRFARFATRVGGRRRGREGHGRRAHRCRQRQAFRCGRRQLAPRHRAHRGPDARPQRLLVRAEASRRHSPAPSRPVPHAIVRSCRAATTQRRCPARSCRPRSPALPRPNPRRCRNDCSP